MKKIFIGALAVTTAFVLTGCAASSDPAPVVTVTESVAPAPQPVTPEDAFLAALSVSGNTYLENIDPATAIDVGHQTCSLLDQGYTVTDIVIGLINTGSFPTQNEQEAVGYLIGAAIGSMCPEYLYQVEGLAS